MGMRLIMFSTPPSTFLILDPGTKLLEYLYILIILPQFILSHIDAYH